MALNVSLKVAAKMSDHKFAQVRAEVDRDTQVALDLLRANPDMSQAEAVRRAHRTNSDQAAQDWQATA